MRVLLDECMPRRLRRELPGHDVRTRPRVALANVALLTKGLVRAMVSRGLTTPAAVCAQLEAMESQLHRFPSINHASFRGVVNAMFPP